eukprot:g28080.t1
MLCVQLLLWLKVALGREGALKNMLLDRQELSNEPSFLHRGGNRALPPSDVAFLYKSYFEEPTTTADTMYDNSMHDSMYDNSSTPMNSTRRRITAIVANWQTCYPGDTCSGGYVCCVAPADTVKTTCRPSSDCKATVPSCSNKVVVSVGSSGGNSKTVTASTSVTCPATVSKYNWLGGYTWNDLFAVTTSGSQVSVRRTDSTTGWGMDLRFECCPAAQVIPQWGTCSLSDTCVSGTVCCVAPADSIKTTCRPSWDCKPPGGGGSSTIRCGSDWTNANMQCGTACQSDANCPSGQKCFRDLSLAPCNGGGTGTCTYTGNDGNVQSTVSWLNSIGVSDPNAISAVIGNFQQESGLNPTTCECRPSVTSVLQCQPVGCSGCEWISWDPSGDYCTGVGVRDRNAYTSTGIGILQWSYDRRNNFLAFCGNQASCNNINTQLSFLVSGQEPKFTDALPCLKRSGASMGTPWDVPSASTTATYWSCVRYYTGWESTTTSQARYDKSLAIKNQLRC